jgi:hypothetical protein
MNQLRLLMIGFGLVAVAGIATVVIKERQKADAARSVAAAYVEHVRAGRMEAAHGLLTAQRREELTPEVLSGMLATAPLKAARSVEVKTALAAGEGRACVRAELSNAPPADVLTLYLAREGEAWRVQGAKLYAGEVTSGPWACPSP